MFMTRRGSKSLAVQLTLMMSLLATDVATGAERTASRTQVVVALRASRISRSDLSSAAALQARKQAINAIQEDVIRRAGLPEESIIHRWKYVRGFSALVTPSELLQLERDPDVLRVDPAIGGHATLLGESVPLIGAADVHEKGWTGSGITVAVIDSGVARDHRELEGAVVAEKCFCRNADLSGCCPNGSAEQSGTGAAADDDGHGTHVAGIVGSRGVALPPGVAPGASIVAIKAIDASGRIADMGQVISALEWLLEDRPDVSVVNMSLGTESRYAETCDTANATTIQFADAVDALVSRGTVVVASSGNDADSGAIVAPGCVQNVLAVGATYDDALPPLLYDTCSDLSPAVDEIACFSNASTALDLLAPGGRIDSLSRTGGQVAEYGTSMAAPHVAGAVAVLLGIRPTMTPGQIEAVLESTGIPLVDSRNDEIYPRLDLSAAVDAVSSSEIIRDGGFEDTESTGNINPAWAAFATGGHNLFRQGDPGSHAGTAHAELGGGSGSSVDYIKERITIPDDTTVAELTFWVNIVTSESSTAPERDHLYVDLYETNGSIAQELTHHTNRDASAYFKVGPIAIYRTGDFDLTFYGSNNSTLSTTFRIDDVSLTATIPEQKPVVTVVASDPDAREAGPDRGVFTFTRTGPTAPSLTVYFSVSGLAAISGDYAPLPDHVTFAAGASTETLNLDPIDDAELEDPETVVITMDQDASYSVGSPSSATVTIKDNDAQVSVSAVDAAAAEIDANTGTFRVTRSGSTAEALAVQISVGGTAENGVDYASLSGSVELPAGSPSADVVVRPAYDLIAEGNETIVLTVSPASGYAVGTPSSATVTIADAFAPPTGVTATAIAPGTVHLTWTIGPGAVSYRVYRTADHIQYEPVGSPTGLTWDDTTALSNTAYLYKVRSFNGNESPDSNVDLATTVMFSDPSIVAGTTVVRATHLTELLSAVNAVRTLSGLQHIWFTGFDPAAGAAITHSHVVDLRAAIDAARAALGLSANVYVDPLLTGGTLIKAAHITQLRQGVE